MTEGVVKVLVAMGAELLQAEGWVYLRDTWVCGGGRNDVYSCWSEGTVGAGVGG